MKFFQLIPPRQNQGQWSAYLPSSVADGENFKKMFSSSVYYSGDLPFNMIAVNSVDIWSADQKNGTVDDTPKVPFDWYDVFLWRVSIPIEANSRPDACYLICSERMAKVLRQGVLGPHQTYEVILRESPDSEQRSYVLFHFEGVGLDGLDFTKLSYSKKDKKKGLTPLSEAESNVIVDKGSYLKAGQELYQQDRRILVYDKSKRYYDKPYDLIMGNGFRPAVSERMINAFKEAGVDLFDVMPFNDFEVILPT